MVGLSPVQVIADEQARLVQELEDLPASVWAAPSRCAGWTNALVVAHLVFYARAYADAMARALTGDSGAPLGADARPFTREQYLAWEREAQVAMAELPPEELLHEFAVSGGELIETLGRMTEADLDLPAYHQSGTYTIGILIYWRIYELGFHAWDVRASFDPAAEIRPDLCPFVLGTLRQLQPWLCRPEPTLEVTCRIEIDGQEAWTARASNGKLEEIAGGTSIDASIRMAACTYLLLATRRQTFADCTDRIAVDGSREQAQALLSACGVRI